MGSESQFKVLVSDSIIASVRNTGAGLAEVDSVASVHPITGVMTALSGVEGQAASYQNLMDLAETWRNLGDVAWGSLPNRDWLLAKLGPESAVVKPYIDLQREYYARAEQAETFASNMGEKIVLAAGQHTPDGQNYNRSLPDKSGTNGPVLAT